MFVHKKLIFIPIYDNQTFVLFAPRKYCYFFKSLPVYNKHDVVQCWYCTHQFFLCFVTMRKASSGNGYKYNYIGLL